MMLFASLQVAPDEDAIAAQYPWAKSYRPGINGHWIFDTEDEVETSSQESADGRG